nr:MAG TPA: hypothetical protein [Caudoviricetes sp.]
MDLNEINAEIAKLEAGGTNYAVCEKLACLYTVRDGLQNGRKPERAMNIDEYSYASNPRQIVLDESQTEFEKAAYSVPVDALISVMDEHMEAIRAIYPKEYTAVVERLKSEKRAGD